MNVAPARFAALGSLCLPVPAAAQSPMSYLHTFGPAGNPATTLGWALGVVSIAVTVVVGAALVLALSRTRPRPVDARVLAVRSDAGGMSWIYIGVGLTVGTLLVCAISTMFVLVAVAMPAQTALTLTVNASQWWWAVRYESDQPAETFSVANEIHIPVGRPVRIELTSSDVIHSFWIPQLGGKMDMIPGQTNVTWLQADSPGVYRGQCGEFCGEQHAHMAMEVVADLPAAYETWKAAQLRPAAAPLSEAARAGRDAFVAHCAACHAVRGAEAGGILGPDLTHLMSRQTIAAGLLPNTPANLGAWIADAQAFKVGARMPSLALPPGELQAIVAYLGTLE